MFWRRLGDFFAACITKGLHTGSIVSPEVPFWLSEIRKRTFGHAYNLDKSISSFMGRPPRLPRKYCSMQLPLDLDLTMLQLSDAQLEIEVEKLDEDGWNTAGDFRSNLYTRSSLVCNMIREDILELALASLPHDNIAVAKNILHRSRAAWESFPAWIRQMREQPHRDGLLRYLSNEVREKTVTVR
jgi:Fungal specific transcription factor domain